MPPSTGATATWPGISCSICNAAGIKVGILGKEEKCCGEPVRKLGNEYLYQMVAAENIELIKGYGVKKIVTTCPHCMNTLGRDYRDLGLDVPVEHYSTFLNRLIGDRSITLQPQQFEFTYHDSCYLGRYMDIIDEPRRVLQAAGGRLTEMENSRLRQLLLRCRGRPDPGGGETRQPDQRCRGCRWQKRPEHRCWFRTARSA